MSYFFTYGAIKNISLRMDRSQNALNDDFRTKITDLRGTLILNRQNLNIHQNL